MGLILRKNGNRAKHFYWMNGCAIEWKLVEAAFWTHVFNTCLREYKSAAVCFFSLYFPPDQPWHLSRRYLPNRERFHPCVIKWELEQDLILSLFVQTPQKIRDLLYKPTEPVDGNKSILSLYKTLSSVWDSIHPYHLRNHWVSRRFGNLILRSHLFMAFLLL